MSTTILIHVIIEDSWVSAHICSTAYFRQYLLKNAMLLCTSYQLRRNSNDNVYSNNNNHVNNKNNSMNINNRSMTKNPLQRDMNVNSHEMYNDQMQ